jgi:small subunit ribosomal protein S6
LETVAKRLYEGMFLVDSAQATADWEGTLSVINTILQRADAEVVAMRKWQERKLAYDIDHKSRGTYILCYFNVDGRRISGIEKDVLLSEKVMRALILTTEKRPAEMIQQDITGEPAEKPEEEKSEAKAEETPAPKEGAEASQEAQAPSEPASPEAGAETPSEAGADEVPAEQENKTDETAG